MFRPDVTFSKIGKIVKPDVKNIKIALNKRIFEYICVDVFDLIFFYEKFGSRKRDLLYGSEAKLLYFYLLVITLKNCQI